MSHFERSDIVKLDNGCTSQMGSNVKNRANLIVLINLRYIVKLIRAKPRPPDFGDLGLAPFSAMVVFWGPTCQELAQNTK